MEENVNVARGKKRGIRICNDKIRYDSKRVHATRFLDAVFFSPRAHVVGVGRYLWLCGESWRMDTCTKNGQNVGLLRSSFSRAISVANTYVFGIFSSIQCATSIERPLFTCVLRLQRHFFRSCLIRSFGDDKLMRHLFQSFFFSWTEIWNNIAFFLSRDFCLVFNFSFLSSLRSRKNVSKELLDTGFV